MNQLTPVAFTKYSGCGNDFVIIDNMCGDRTSCQSEATIKLLCNRSEGVGADGIIFLELSENSVFRMRIFQPDGKEVEMCGNGLRCLGHYIHSLYPDKIVFEVLTKYAPTRIHVDGDDIAIEMPSPAHLQMNRSMLIAGKDLTVHTINTGVPHAILFVEDLEADHLMDLGKQLRYDPTFAPAGTNVNFVKVISPHTLEIRTYERGVEAETLACGTGATAAALVAAAHYAYASPLRVKTRSGEAMTVTFQESCPVMLKGPAKVTFKGVILLPLVASPFFPFCS